MRLNTVCSHLMLGVVIMLGAQRAQAADPPRQELLRRMNMAPGGTGTLIAMRSEITAHLRHEPELRLLDADLRHLFASWFNRGFLELRRIDWQSPAAVLEKLAEIKMIDVWIPTVDQRWLILPRYTQPSPDTKLLIEKLKLQLPSQPPPRLVAQKQSYEIQVPTVR